MPRMSMVLGATAALSISLTSLTPAHAALTSDPDLGADYGARWLAAQFVSDGVGGKYIASGPGNTLQSALALAAAGVEEATFEDAVDWLEDNVSGTIVVNSADDPARIGYLLLVAAAAGEDPYDFGGVDLVDRLDSTLGEFEAGLYGEADPSWDGVFRQSLAVLGLLAVNESVPGAAEDWLAGQQCPAGSASGSVGAFEPYRTGACVAADTETNSTSLAVQALAELGGHGTEVGLAVDWFDALQESDAGFPFAAGYGSDPNSTSLVLQALVAAGEDPTSGDWRKSGADPYDSLLSWQLDCTEDPADVGSFASPWSGGAPDQLAGQQAVWGLASAPFPLSPSFATTTPTPCGP